MSFKPEDHELDVLDIDRWVKQFPHPPEEGGFGCLITGPADIAHVVQLRSKALVGTSDLAAVPCDIFVFAQGEPMRRDVTKVNGVPYRPAALPWPVTVDGEPMTFLAQFRFTESADLTGKLPGDILLVFISDDDLYPFDQPQETLRFEWYPLGLDALVSADQCPPPRWRFAHCYGFRYRTVDYTDPRAEPLFMRVIPSEARRSTPDDLLVRPLCRLDGMKIGGAPLWFDGETSTTGPDWETISGRFLCSLASIEPELDEPYSWVNHPEAIGFDERTFKDDMLLFCLNAFILNFFIDEDGHITWGMQMFT